MKMSLEMGVKCIVSEIFLTSHHISEGDIKYLFRPKLVKWKPQNFFNQSILFKNFIVVCFNCGFLERIRIFSFLQKGGLQTKHDSNVCKFLYLTEILGYTVCRPAISGAVSGPATSAFS